MSSVVSGLAFEGLRTFQNSFGVPDSYRKGAKKKAKRSPAKVPSTYQRLASGDMKMVSLARQKAILKRPAMMAFTVRDPKGRKWEDYQVPEEGTKDYDAKMKRILGARWARQRDDGSSEYVVGRKKSKQASSQKSPKKQKRPRSQK